MNKYHKIMDEALMQLLEALSNDQEPYGVVVSPDDNWEFPLPKEIAGVKPILLNISGWTLEQSYVEKNSLYLKVAFGDDENSKRFSPGDILAVLDKDGRQLYQRVFITEERKPEYTLKSLIGMPPNDAPDGVKNSMDAMRRNNPDAFKKE
jgi:hypothetical protein